MAESVFFDEITLLVTHYNRSLSLERLLKSFEDRQIRFNEIVVSDDGSQSEHLNRLNQLKEKFGFSLICADKNRGLANNINKGQRAVSSTYTLYIQEDFIPTEQFYQRLTDGLELMKENLQIDLVRFYAYHRHPYLKPVKYGFSEMEFHFWHPGFWQFFCYSDHPHLRRSDFLQKFGDYHEGISSDRAEFRMAISFLQKKGKAIIHENFRDIFIQENSAQEPSQVSRKQFRKYLQLTNSFLIKFIRMLYRNIKFRVDYIFLK
jgi:glycosyltransferase involved in cell wall biosynthesis